MLKLEIGFYKLCQHFIPRDQLHILSCKKKDGGNLIASLGKGSLWLPILDSMSKDGT